MGGVSFAPVPGTDGKYVADSEGNIYGHRGQLKPWFAKSASVRRRDGQRHLAVRFWRGTGSYSAWSVHRAVFAAFHGDIPDGLEIRHVDGDPTNNRVTNLAVGTTADNKEDSRRHGTIAQGERHGMSKLTAGQVQDIRRRLAAGESQRSIGVVFNVHKSTIGLIARGKHWRSV